MIIVKIIGGLGNQLFQYSTGRALALKYNTELKLDLSFFDDLKYKNTLRLDKFKLPYEIAKEVEITKLKNKSASFTINWLNRLGLKLYPFKKKTHLIETDVNILVHMTKANLTQSYYLDGWLGDETYFIQYRDVLLNELNIDQMLSPSNKELQQEITKNNSISVHIRRGDYLKNSYFHNLPTEYYITAINYLSSSFNNSVFYFFSDDVTWVKKEFSSLPNAVFVDGNSEHDTAHSTSGDLSDLMLMRSCKYNIIANSTFSWWGAWLNNNPNKVVIAPKIWYNDKLAQENYDKGELIPETWIKI